MSGTVERGNRIERTEYQTVTPLPGRPDEPSINGPFRSLADARGDLRRLRSFGYEPQLEERQIVEVRAKWHPVEQDGDRS